MPARHRTVGYNYVNLHNITFCLRPNEVAEGLAACFLLHSTITTVLAQIATLLHFRSMMLSRYINAISSAEGKQRTNLDVVHLYPTIFLTTGFCRLHIQCQEIDSKRYTIKYISFKLLFPWRGVRHGFFVSTWLGLLRLLL